MLILLWIFFSLFIFLLQIFVGIYNLCQDQDIFLSLPIAEDPPLHPGVHCAEASLHSSMARAPGEDAAAASRAAMPGAERQHTWEPRLDTERARSGTAGPGQELPCTERASLCSVCHSAKQAALSIFPAGATRRIRQVIYSQFIFIFLLAGMRSYTKISLLGESVSFPPQESSAPPASKRFTET